MYHLVLNRFVIHSPTNNKCYLISLFSYCLAKNKCPFHKMLYAYFPLVFVTFYCFCIMKLVNFLGDENIWLKSILHRIGAVNSKSPIQPCVSFRNMTFLQFLLKPRHGTASCDIRSGTEFGFWVAPSSTCIRKQRNSPQERLTSFLALTSLMLPIWSALSHPCAYHLAANSPKAKCSEMFFKWA